MLIETLKMKSNLAITKQPRNAWCLLDALTLSPRHKINYYNLTLLLIVSFIFLLEDYISELVTLTINSSMTLKPKLVTCYLHLCRSMNLNKLFCNTKQRKNMSQNFPWCSLHLWTCDTWESARQWRWEQYGVIIKIRVAGFRLGSCIIRCFS